MSISPALSAPVPSCRRRPASTPCLLAFLTLTLAAPIAQAQQFPQDATPGQCLPTPHLAPGDAPGGNVYNQNAGPQAQTAPNNQVATYPDIQPVTPDPIPNDAIPQNDINFQPFPFSGGINDPALSPTGGPETSSTTNKGC